MDDTPSGSVKRLTIANWRERDAAARGFVRVRDGSAQEIAPDEWAAVFLAPQLGADVPRDIVDLLEVARGALCYGVFFYPLYALGSEQVYRVLESALRHRCASAGAPGTIGNFMNMLEWLRARGLINAEHSARWQASRQLRNMASHPDRQSIVMPTMAASTLETAVQLINALFETGARASRRA